jgi:hypothetical protein
VTSATSRETIRAASTSAVFSTAREPRLVATSLKGRGYVSRLAPGYRLS